MLHYPRSLSDINVIYLIHMQREGTVVNGRTTRCHGINQVRDLNQKVLKFLAFLSNNSLYLLVFVLEPQLMYIYAYIYIYQHGSRSLQLVGDLSTLGRRFICVICVSVVCSRKKCK